MPHITSRQFSSSRPHRSAAPPPPPPQSGYTSLPSRRLLTLSGPDAPHFLQGILTNNISAPGSSSKTLGAPRTSGFFAAFLNAQGRVLHDVFVYPDPSGALCGTAGANGENWVVECDSAEAERLYKWVRRYKLRAKFDLKLVPVGEARVWQAWDERGTGEEGKGWTRHGLSNPAERTGSSSKTEGVLALADTRAPGMGRRLLVPGAAKPADQLVEGLEESTHDSYTIRRYLKGVPEGQSEILRESALPQESNIDYMHGIDYRKGCYVGQELTIRTHHTGVVRKRILPVVLYPADAPAAPTSLGYDPSVSLDIPPLETSIAKAGGRKGRSAGKFLAGIGNVGLGLCRLGMMTDLRLAGEPEGTYKEGDEFAVTWISEGTEEGTEEGKSVKVKAFVPSWHLQGR
jgi:folate-binding protein YgfZ